ncbi:hypothetical protein SAMN05216414_102191 [Nitrosovibrio sp. Nv17]|nr:hypothetical protein SAMN05216414_102191 [Nitrosovibrio sp. Nv17]
MSSRDLFNLAEAYIDNEDMGQAKELIQQAMALGPMNEDIISRAVVLLVYMELYSSARKVYEDYRQRTGLELSDYTYARVVQWEQENRVVDDVPVFDLTAGPLRFVRLSDMQRGDSTLVRTDLPVGELEVSEQGIRIVQSGIKYQYEWKEITRASIVTRMIPKGMRSDTPNYSQKICTLEAPEEKRFQFDVSSTNPDFGGALLLRAILEKYLDVESIDERKPGFKAGEDDPIRNLKRGDRNRMLLIIGGIILFLIFLELSQSSSG